MIEVKDHLDRGVQITNDDYTVRLSGPDGVIAFDKDGLVHLLDELGVIETGLKHLPEPEISFVKTPPENTGGEAKLTNG